MNIEALQIEKEDLRKLLGSASGDASMLYLYLRCGNALENAGEKLSMSQEHLACATATLTQLGLWQLERPRPIQMGARPGYGEKDVLEAMDSDGDFRLLYGEIQRLLGRSLNTEELKILLSFTRYLGLPGEVISLLVSFCKNRARQKGNLRSPSLRSIEKEAYRWAEQGIDTLESAASYIHSQNVQATRMAAVLGILQIHGRALTPAEERYAAGWLEMGISNELIAAAYEKTCLNTGRLNWAYMNKILTSWHTSGLKTLEDVKSGDRKNGVPTGASGALGQAELEAIQRVLQEG